MKREIRQQDSKETGSPPIKSQSAHTNIQGTDPVNAKEEPKKEESGLLKSLLSRFLESFATKSVDKLDQAIKDPEPTIFGKLAAVFKSLATFLINFATLLEDLQQRRTKQYHEKLKKDEDESKELETFKRKKEEERIKKEKL